MGAFRQLGNANLFVQPTQPLGWLNGDLWSDTSTNPITVFVNNNGTPYTVLAASASITISGITDTLEHFIQMAAQ